jgi:hypothetical protein
MDSGKTPVPGHTRRLHRPSTVPAHLPRRRIEIDVPDVEKQ